MENANEKEEEEGEEEEGEGGEKKGERQHFCVSILPDFIFGSRKEVDRRKRRKG